MAGAVVPSAGLFELRKDPITSWWVATIVDRGARVRMAEEGLDYRTAFTLQDLGL